MLGCMILFRSANANVTAKIYAVNFRPSEDISIKYDFDGIDETYYSNIAS